MNTCLFKMDTRSLHDPTDHAMRLWARRECLPWKMEDYYNRRNALKTVRLGRTPQHVYSRQEARRTAAERIVQEI